MVGLGFRFGGNKARSIRTRYLSRQNEFKKKSRDVNATAPKTRRK